MAERRNTLRKSSAYYLRVFEKGNRSQNGRLIDLSPFGMTLVSEEPFRKAEQYKFQMALPETIPERKQMTIEVQCVWCREDKEPGQWLSGFQVVNLNAKNRELLERLYS